MPKQAGPAGGTPRAGTQKDEEARQTETAATLQAMEAEGRNTTADPTLILDPDPDALMAKTDRRESQTPHRTPAPLEVPTQGHRRAQAPASAPQATSTTRPDGRLLVDRENGDAVFFS